MRVYFIRAVGGFGPVKVGCSKVPERRLDTLMTYAPYPLEIAASIAGGYDLERRFHHMFREHHSHREWFKPHPLIERTIEQIKAGTFDIGVLPAPKNLPTPKRAPWTAEQRESASLSHRLRHGPEGHGIYLVPEIRSALYRFDRMSERGRNDLRRMVELHLQDPRMFGVVSRAKGARKAAATYLAQREAA